jgi:uncharacterized protein with HEPN domain
MNDRHRGGEASPESVADDLDDHLLDPNAKTDWAAVEAYKAHVRRQEQAHQDLQSLGGSVVDGSLELSEEEARMRLGMPPEVWERACQAYYTIGALHVKGEETPRVIYGPKNPEPEPVGLIQHPEREWRPAALVLRNPWEIVDLDEHVDRDLMNALEASVVALNRELQAWVRHGYSRPLPAQLIAASDEYKTALRRLVAPVLDRTGRRLSDFKVTLPSDAAYAALHQEMYIYRMEDALRRTRATVAKGWDHFSGDQDARDAVIRRIEVIGECLKVLDESPVAQRHAGLPWSELPRMRDYLAHQFVNGIDATAIWHTASVELPEVARVLGI